MRTSRKFSNKFSVFLFQSKLFTAVRIKLEKPFLGMGREQGKFRCYGNGNILSKTVPSIENFRVLLYQNLVDMFPKQSEFISLRHKLGKSTLAKMGCSIKIIRRPFIRNVSCFMCAH